MTQRELWEMIGRGGGKGGGDGNSIINTLSSCLLQFFRFFFCTESIIRKKKWPSTEQATNETVAINPGGNLLQIQIDTCSVVIRSRDPGTGTHLL